MDTLWPTGGRRVEIKLLGPVEVVASDGQTTNVAGVKQRSVLAMLSLSAGQTVPVERLLDAVWRERLPSTARRQVLNCVASVRRVVGPALTTAPSGYRLERAHVDTDVARFERSVAAAHSAIDRGRTAEAIDLLDAALSLWRGPALSGTTGLAASADRLDDLRLEAIEQRARLLVAEGHHGVVAELRELAATHPERESVLVLLMQALYRSGRQIEALDVYRRAVTVLAEEFGIDPGPRLRRCHEAILRGEADLEPSAQPGALPAP
jgi:DNA-binding SARP family transcriptional activator